MKLGQAAVSTTTTIKVPFVPEMLILVNATLANITSCKVNVFGVGVILDLLNAGIVALDAMGQVADDSTSYTIPLANGKWVNKDCEITIVSGATVTDVYGFGTRLGTHFIKHTAEKYLALNAVDVDKFLFLAVPTAADADSFTVVHNVQNEVGEIVGTFNEQMVKQDIVAVSGAFQGRTGIHFNNFNQLYKSVNIKFTADTVVYYSRVVEG